MSRNVVTVDARATFVDAAKVLHEHRISSVVVKKKDAPAGIVTERDFVNLIAKLMAERRIRHLPVVDRGRPVGIISIRDLTSWAVGEIAGPESL